MDAGSREVPYTRMLPYASFVTEYDLMTRGGGFIRFFELEPVPFETSDAQRMQALHDMVCAWLASLSDEFIIYRYVTQFYEDVDMAVPSAAGYAKLFHDDYAADQRKRPFLVNRLFLALLHTPNYGKGSLTREQINRHHKTALQAMHERSLSLQRMLCEFAPQVLGNVERNGVLFSRAAEFAGLLVNGRWLPVRAGTGSIAHRLPAVRPSAAGGVVELRGIDDVRYAAMLDVSEYADEPEAGHLTALLYEPIEFILAQSFRPMSRRKAMKSMERQMRQLQTAADKVQSQISAMEEGIDHVGAGTMTWGEHFCSLATFGRTTEDALYQASIAAGAVAETTGIYLKLVDLLADAAWLAQCPGNLWHRTRKAEISSRAFAALTAGHGFFRGKEHGNPWGLRVMAARTSSGGVIFLSWHASPLGEDSFGMPLPANTVITGRVRSGKTTWEAAMLVLSRLLPTPPRILVLDFKRGLEIVVRRLGGTYLQFKAGEPTGINPLQWPVTPRLRAFLPQWVMSSLMPDMKLEPSERLDLEQAIEIVLGMEWGMRTLSSVWEMLPINGPRGQGNTMRAALSRWIDGGTLGWAFDQADDRLPHKITVAGYDYTEFLDHAELRAPMVMALMEYGDTLLDGTPFIQVVAETWRATQDKTLGKVLHDKARTINRQNGVLVMDTQEPGDLVDNSDDPDSIGNTLIAQTPTIACFHDDQSPDEAYLKTLRLTEAELNIVRTLAHRPGRCFLFKQNGQSAIVNFDLSGIGDHLIALSGSEKNVRLLDEIRAEVGDDPEVWWPVLVQRVHERDRKARVYQLPNDRKAA
jgi:type IV secretion system protein VirB4